MNSLRFAKKILQFWLFEHLCKFWRNATNCILLNRLCSLLIIVLHSLGFLFNKNIGVFIRFVISCKKWLENHHNFAATFKIKNIFTLLPACSAQTCSDFRLIYFGVFSCISNDSRSLSPEPIRFLSRSRLPTFGSAWMPPFIDVVGIWSRTQFCFRF